ncbi:MAG: alpha/beta hydrolase [Pseudomonadota bacterium]|uniref:alpha/beta fold hydrolase n=1 Tax=Sphingomonas sp. ERG5 TaxID=1381597 RepID=UPI00069098BF|nr:alpha/beta hydrolase [Sphingomonas sp. ERG5]
MTVIFVILIVLAALVATGLFYTKARTRFVERQVPAQGSFIEIDGQRLHYVDKGPVGQASGDAIVLIHGLAGNSHNFTYSLTEILARHHRVVVIDRPGSGYSAAMPGGFSLVAQADLVAALIAKLGLDRPLVVGHSLGGAVTLTLAVTHPASLRGVALLAALTRVIDTPPAAFKGLNIRSRGVRRFVASVIAVPMSVLAGSKSAVQVFAPESVPDDFGLRGGGLLVQRPSAVFTASTELTQTPDALAPIVARYGEIGMPVAILYGRGDAILDPVLHGERLPEVIAHADVTLIEGGHMIPLTAPTEVAAWIERALERSREVQAA